jgi:hypothetical protein
LILPITMVPCSCLLSDCWMGGSPTRSTCGTAGRLEFRFNANNMLNKQFISQSDTNIHPESGEAEWNGVNMNNRVYFGNGFTWNISAAYRF